jgi:hypothetical protein
MPPSPSARAPRGRSLDTEPTKLMDANDIDALSASIVKFSKKVVIVEFTPKNSKVKFQLSVMDKNR